MLNAATMSKWLAGVLMIAALAVVTDAYAHEERDIVDVAISDSRFSTFVAALEAADMIETMRSEGPYTVFAPTNRAFDALPEGMLESLLESENQAKLQAILAYHILSGKVMGAELNGSESTRVTIQGEELSMNGIEGVNVGGAEVIATDLQASNGIVHTIDQVLLPPSMQ